MSERGEQIDQVEILCEPRVLREGAAQKAPLIGARRIHDQVTQANEPSAPHQLRLLERQAFPEHAAVGRDPEGYAVERDTGYGVTRDEPGNRMPVAQLHAVSVGHAHTRRSPVPAAAPQDQRQRDPEARAIAIERAHVELVRHPEQLDRDARGTSRGVPASRRAGLELDHSMVARDVEEAAASARLTGQLQRQLGLPHRCDLQQFLYLVGRGHEVVLLFWAPSLGLLDLAERERGGEGARAVAAMERRGARYLCSRGAQEPPITDDLHHRQNAALGEACATAHLTEISPDASNREHVVATVVNSSWHDQNQQVRSA
jgi:hypothetical protein